MTINARIQRIDDEALALLAELNDEYDSDLRRYCYSLREGWHAWALLAMRAGQLSDAASIEEAWEHFAGLPGMESAWFRRGKYTSRTTKARRAA